MAFPYWRGQVCFCSTISCALSAESFRTGTVAVGIEDFFYWLVCTGVVFVMLYRENDGMVRGFALLGMAVGTVLYYLLLSRYVVSLHVFLLKSVLQLLHKVFGVLFAPVIRLGKKVGRFLKKELKKLVRAVKMGLCKL